MSKIKLLKKAYIVNDPTVCEDYYPFCDDDIVYANDISDAKKQCKDYSHFINIRVKRYKESDKVEYNGQEMMRDHANFLFKKEQRKKDFLKIAHNEFFYIQDTRTYVGNSVLWWGINGKGYTTDILSAHKYKKEEILKNFDEWRETDKFWIADHVNKHIKSHIDMQYLDLEYSV